MNFASLDGPAAFAAPALLASWTESLPAWLASPIVWTVLLGALALLALLPRGGRSARRAGVALGAAALVALVVSGQAFGELPGRVTFWILAVFTLAASAAAVSSRSAVYSAVWFAVSLLGVAGLLMLQNAQFLGVATIVVYAGAIVVTFLFVVMLAQPDGHDIYDRLSWGTLAKPAAVATTAVFLSGVLSACQELRNAPPLAANPAGVGPDTPHHMASLGNELFGRHLVSIEVAGTLLLAALVAAVAIVGAHRANERSTARTDGDASGARSGEGASA